MASLNEANLIGHLGADPKITTLNEGVKVARLSLATSETFTNKKGERVESTEWHNIVLWRGLAEVAEKYMHKGDQVFIKGKIKTRKYADKDGKDKYVTEIEAFDIILLAKKPGTSSGTPQNNYQPQYQQQQPQTSSQYSHDTPVGLGEGDLPF